KGPHPGDPGAEPRQRQLQREARHHRAGQAQAGPHVLQRGNGQEVHADGAGGRRPQRAAAGEPHHLAARDLLPHQAHHEGLVREHLRQPERVRPAHRGPRGHPGRAARGAARARGERGQRGGPACARRRRPPGRRRLARRLHEEYKLPVYVLVDNDPWGYYIYSVVKQGSINLAFESERMAIPKAKFIGLSSADPDRYGLPRNVGIKLNDKDVGRAKELLKYRWFQKKHWQNEIKRMLGAGLKYELDALANKDFRYLTKTYLPRKLKEEDWLDDRKSVV